MKTYYEIQEALNELAKPYQHEFPHLSLRVTSNDVLIRGAVYIYGHLVNESGRTIGELITALRRYRDEPRLRAKSYREESKRLLKAAKQLEASINGKPAA